MRELPSIVGVDYTSQKTEDKRKAFQLLKEAVLEKSVSRKSSDFNVKPVDTSIYLHKHCYQRVEVLLTCFHAISPECSRFWKIAVLRSRCSEATCIIHKPSCSLYCQISHGQTDTHTNQLLQPLLHMRAEG